jgi:flagellin
MNFNYNSYSWSIYRNYSNAVSENTDTVEKMSSGSKLNSSKDNPKKVSESMRLKIDILSRKAAEDNVQDTESMIQTFDGSLQEMNNNISRLKQLVVQAANGINSEEDISSIQSEMDEINNSINDLANNTEFNGIKLSQDDGTTKKATIGAQEDESIDIPFYNVTAYGLGLEGMDITSADADTDQYLDDIDAAIKKVSTARSKYGSIQNRLEDLATNINDINDTLISAQSDIADADIATETLENSTSQILIEASISLMTQSNQLPQDCLNILSSI